MKIARKYTTAGQSPFDSVEFEKRTSRISNPDGTVVFEMTDAEIPASWSQLATDIMVSKYFRKAGVPQAGADGKVLRDEQGNVVTGPEKSVKQVVHRLVGCWRWWAETHGYFDTAEDAQAFYDELAYMLIHQMCAPNSPQWFNTGLNWAYGITGPSQGHFYCDPQTGELKKASDAYSHPQPHACFIQSVQDDLVNPGGIMDLWVREARLFKYGSGTGSNFSRIRGESEKLSGGGRSSGLMSFLKIGDRAAGAIKSGGTTRRAAKMCCLDLDHPDIEEFVNWKVREEVKVAALAEGIKALPKDQRELAEKLKLKLDYDFNGEAYHTVSGQNSNNSVRIPNKFFHLVEEDGDWELTFRCNGKVAKRVKARDLWDQIAFAAWRCADPGVQFDDTINQWHTCPKSGRINASNPCSEYMFLDDTACNLASLNVLQFFDSESRTFDIERFKHGIRLWTIVLEVSVLMASFPAEDIARLSYEFRTLGLGYANLGAMLMQAGIAYNSDKGRAICSAITAILCGESYATSAEMAEELGAFPGYAKNKEEMLRVIRNHRRAAYDVTSNAVSRKQIGDFEALEIKPIGIEAGQFADTDPLASTDMLAAAQDCWDRALSLGEKHGYRNAQTTVIAPTGTIGLLMDCDTTGVEPDFALVKFKKLAGGGYFKIANQSLRPALVSLGYEEEQINQVMAYVMGTLTLKGAPHINPQSLKTLGFTEDDLRRIEDALPSVFDLSFAFAPWTLGEETMKRLKIAETEWKAPGFNLLKRLGFTNKQISAAAEVICGQGTVEGAPHLKVEDYPVFECANRCGKNGKLFIPVEGHIHMMAAAQPFISGAISKTINLPNEATVEQIKDSYLMSWKMGLKANALYRDGSKLSQPLNVKSDEELDKSEEDDQENVEAAKEELVKDVVKGVNRIEAIAAEVRSDNLAPAHSNVVEKIVEKIVERPLRRRLPDTRNAITHKFDVAGHEGYITVGLYDDGMPGEVFITMAKEGSTIGGLMDTIATLVSVSLQYGVPVESLVRKFEHVRFEPSGPTRNREIPFAKSLTDYIFRWLAMEFIPGYRAQFAPKRPGEGDKKSDKEGAPATKPLTSNGVQIPEGATITAGGRLVGVKATNLKLVPVDVLSQQGSQMQADAPACDVCGSITVRSGTCYKCLNCGNSMGCS